LLKTVIKTGCKAAIEISKRV